MSKKRRRMRRLRQNKLRKIKLEFAKQIEKHTPKSELWFRELYKPYHHRDDEYNQLFGGFIPDVINKFYKYIIEIDGSIHLTEKQKAKDRKKDKRFRDLGYKVIRIEAYNSESFQKAMDKICKIRGPNYKPAKILTQDEINKLYQIVDEDRE